MQQLKGGAIAQVNHITGIAYLKSNQFALQQAKAQNKYRANAWLTFNQGKSLGMAVRAGEKGIQLIRVGHRGENEDGEFFKTHFTVFNLDQFIPANTINAPALASGAGQVFALGAGK